MYFQNIFIITTLLLSTFVVPSDCQGRYQSYFESIKQSLAKLFVSPVQCTPKELNTFKCSGNITHQSFEDWSKATYSFEINILCINSSAVEMKLSVSVLTATSNATIQHIFRNGKTTVPIKFSQGTVHGELTINMNMFFNKNDLRIQSQFSLNVSNIDFSPIHQQIFGSIKNFTCIKAATTKSPEKTTSTISPTTLATTTLATTTLVRTASATTKATPSPTPSPTLSPTPSQTTSATSSAMSSTTTPTVQPSKYFSVVARDLGGLMYDDVNCTPQTSNKYKCDGSIKHDSFKEWMGMKYSVDVEIICQVERGIQMQVAVTISQSKVYNGTIVLNLKNNDTYKNETLPFKLSIFTTMSFINTSSVNVQTSFTVKYKKIILFHKMEGVVDGLKCGEKVPTTPVVSTKTTKVTTKSESHSKPAKVVLLVLALLIILAVVGIYIYFKRKRRLSDQPAYYNDIAINDPLRSLVDEEEEETSHKDDDELLLFA